MCVCVRAYVRLRGHPSCVQKCKGVVVMCFCVTFLCRMCVCVCFKRKPLLLTCVQERGGWWWRVVSFFLNTFLIRVSSKVEFVRPPLSQV